jgi:D-tyrosyl-tRNA(Tyr) deacylase
VRALVQRVTRARVLVRGEVVGEIGTGLVALVGVTHADREQDARWLAGKVAGLRVFGDVAGRMNQDVRDVHGGVLVVPQFTLYGDTRHGRRPDFVEAARPEAAAPLIRSFCAALEGQGVRVERGVFREHMAVQIENDGPVTLMIESPRDGADR